VASDGFGLFNHRPKKQEARPCLRCTEGLMEMLGWESALLAGTRGVAKWSRGSIAVHGLQKQSRGFARGRVFHGVG